MRMIMLVMILFLSGCEKHPIAEPLLPSVAAIQQKLNELEPENPLKVDGKVGPKTIEKWNRVYCEQSAKKASEGYYIGYVRCCWDGHF